MGFPIDGAITSPVLSSSGQGCVHVFMLPSSKVPPCVMQQLVLGIWLGYPCNSLAVGMLELGGGLGVSVLQVGALWVQPVCQQGDGNEWQSIPGEGGMGK